MKRSEIIKIAKLSALKPCFIKGSDFVISLLMAHLDKKKNEHIFALQTRITVLKGRNRLKLSVPVFKSQDPFIENL